MRKIFLAALMLCAAIPAVADNTSQTLLAKLSGRIKEMGNYHAGFEINAEGNMITGSYAVNGDKYFMRTDDYMVVSDGKTKYEINHYDREVIVDRVDAGDHSVLSNPTRAFEFASDVFSNSYAGTQTIGGVVCDVVKLTPNDRNSALKSITLTIGRTTGLPVEIRYRSEGTSDEVSVRIVKIEAGTPKDATFKFNRADYAGYEIIDFR